jgi:predicted Fe-Mo cluster-binding NifX family protein
LLDAARRLVLVEVSAGRVSSRVEHLIAQDDRAAAVARLGVDVLVCGAISRRLEQRLGSLGVEVLGDICGSVDEVIRAFCDGTLGADRFAMPGSSRRGRSPNRPRSALTHGHP